MQTLILPGYSASNKEWVDETSKSLKVDGIIRPFYWMHWTDENSKFDVNEKANLIIKHIKDDKVNIIAKSLGTLVACLICQRIPDQIEKVVLNGLPLRDINEQELETIKSVIRAMGSKVTVFQNISDPHGNYDEVKDFGHTRMTNRDDHNYPFYAEFQDFLK